MTDRRPDDPVTAICQAIQQQLILLLGEPDLTLDLLSRIVDFTSHARRLICAADATKAGDDELYRPFFSMRSRPYSGHRSFSPHELSGAQTRSIDERMRSSPVTRVVQNQLLEIARSGCDIEQLLQINKLAAAAVMTLGAALGVETGVASSPGMRDPMDSPPLPQDSGDYQMGSGSGSGWLSPTMMSNPIGANGSSVGPQGVNDETFGTIIASEIVRLRSAQTSLEDVVKAIAHSRDNGLHDLAKKIEGKHAHLWEETPAQVSRSQCEFVGQDIPPPEPLAAAPRMSSINGAGWSPRTPSEVAAGDDSTPTKAE